MFRVEFMVRDKHLAASLQVLADRGVINLGVSPVKGPPDATTSRYDEIRTLINNLPPKFCVSDLKSSGVSNTSIYGVLRNEVKAGKIKNIARGQYRKMKGQTL